MLKNKYYRLAYKFHERWSPYPRSADDWAQAAQEAAQTCSENGNDKLLLALMAAVYGDLSREYEHSRKGVTV